MGTWNCTPAPAQDLLNTKSTTHPYRQTDPCPLEVSGAGSLGPTLFRVRNLLTPRSSDVPICWCHAHRREKLAYGAWVKNFKTSQRTARCKGFNKDMEIGEVTTDHRTKPNCMYYVLKHQLLLRENIVAHPPTSLPKGFSPPNWWVFLQQTSSTASSLVSSENKNFWPASLLLVFGKTKKKNNLEKLSVKILVCK